MNVFHDYISELPDIIEDARNGRMFILVDAEDRENEGDLVIPAQMCTPQAINFMARFGRGLICLALTEERAAQLKLPMMAAENRTRNQTAFTVSIEAKEGISTGISAHDRAHTVSVAIDPTKGPDDIVMPGHVFPLVARHGGVLIRTGHTEAAVDIARLSGLYPAGVICEIMNDDGTMARLPDLVKFAQLHGLKVGTIADLIAYRRKHDHFVKRIKEMDFESGNGGPFKLMIYLNTIENQEHVALVKGDISGPEPVLVRMHAYNLFDDTLAAKWGPGDILGESMRMIGKAGRGVVVLIRRHRIAPISEVLAQSTKTMPDIEQSRLKEYGVGAQILLDLGVENMTLLTNAKGRRIVALEGYGLKVSDTLPVVPGALK
ncbi:MAG TPA: 3,4-dihydroxy-2-butanone-4-phosphate synthase [Micropepsaceae bacterium]|jgi:3,4-dihydroxy 2-butanone 4-phosphate synthase/GTP cyclohydrolase II|nr:3,4-dihydroxy-2-butanone-4-phosphate synthase [Micropepsaceae bacterium]